MVILITGASTGIGRAAAIHLALKGHTIWAGIRDETSAEDLRKMNVRGLYPVHLDVTAEKSVEHAMSLIRKKSGLLHALINNAGIVVAGPVEGIPLTDWQRQMDVNVLGVVRVTQAALPLLRESKGRIVNVSSISGRLASPFLAPYAASKFALEALSDSLRRELKPQGILVSVIEPGPIKTPLWKKSREHENQRTYSAEVQQIYGEMMDGFRRFMEKSEEEGDAVSLVTGAIEHALISSFPRTRYPVGRGIRWAAGLAGLLSDRVWDKLLLKRQTVNFPKS